MNSIAFSAPLVFNATSTSRRARVFSSRSVLYRRSTRCLPSVASQRATWIANAMYGKDGTPDASAEDERLQSELQAKVNELFGGRQNVTIDMKKDSDVRFIVRRSTSYDRKSESPEVQWLRSPRYIMTFIIVVSVVTGAFFTALYYSGAVHGYDLSDNRHFEMPTYGKDSYIDPYEMLRKEQLRRQGPGPQNEMFQSQIQQN